jgi:hypothetical protein
LQPWASIAEYPAGTSRHWIDSLDERGGSNVQEDSLGGPGFGRTHDRLCVRAGRRHVAPGGGAGGVHKNLKILPATLSKGDMKNLMKGMSAALGVKCDFCHNPDDFASDANKHKGIARAMMKMTNDINKQHFKGKSVVGCVTCHNGQKEPKHL